MGVIDSVLLLGYVPQGFYRIRKFLNRAATRTTPFGLFAGVDLPAFYALYSYNHMLSEFS